VITPSGERHVIVIGAGMGGLAAACDLARQGVRVSLFESASEPGGKMHQQTVAGRHIDSGPTVLTMRWVFDDLLRDCGMRLEDGLRLHPLSVLARHAWSPDEQLDLFADPARSAEAIAAFASPAESRRFLAFCEEARRIYQLLEDAYIRASRPTLMSMATDLGLRGVGMLSALGPFASLWRSLGRHFHDPRLRQLFARYATYCGGSPWLSPATLMLVAHVEMCGVWAAEGGMQSVARRLARAARALGSQLHFDHPVTQIVLQGGRACGVRLQDGRQIQADALIFNGDVQALAQGLVGDEARRAAPQAATSPRSLSALTFALCARAEGFEPSYHNVFFQPDYASEFSDVFEHARLPQQGTAYVCAQDRIPGVPLPADGIERLFVLINAPACGDHRPLTSEEIAQCERRVFKHLNHCGLQLSQESEPRLIRAPQHFHQRFPGSGGALYGAAPHGWMSVFRRPCSQSRIPGLYLAGGSAHPGAGVPMTALSGRLAAATLMAHLDSTRRSHRVRISGGMSTASATVVDTPSP
jgi:1-hydroxycarotenoid 3,4-desaturase